VDAPAGAWAAPPGTSRPGAMGGGRHHSNTTGSPASRVDGPCFRNFRRESRKIPLGSKSPTTSAFSRRQALSSRFSPSDAWEASNGRE
jgi:hypothetical protein